MKKRSSIVFRITLVLVIALFGYASFSGITDNLIRVGRLQQEEIKKEDDLLRFWTYTGLSMMVTVCASIALLMSFATTRDKSRPNQPPQSNAGSRPSSGDSPASETPSASAPRG